MTKLITNFGPEAGPVMYQLYQSACRVNDGDRTPNATIGIGFPEGRDPRNRQLWHLTVNGEELPGRWVIVDRVFVKADR
jgi:hypothetical protein